MRWLASRRQARPQRQVQPHHSSWRLAWAWDCHCCLQMRAQARLARRLSLVPLLALVPALTVVLVLALLLALAVVPQRAWQPAPAGQVLAPGLARRR